MFGDKNPNEKVIEPVIVDQQVDNKGSVVSDGSYVEKNWQDVVVEIMKKTDFPYTTEENLNPNLPTEYTQLDYLLAKGSQYIETGVYGDAICELDIQFLNEGGSTQWMGPNYTNGVFGVNGSNYAVQDWVKFSAKKGNRDKLIFTAITGQKGILSVNGQEFQTYSNISLKDTNQWLLFKPENYIYGYCNAKLYSCQFYQNDTLVRDYIPCVRNEDGIAGLYDFVNGTFVTTPSRLPFNTWESGANFNIKGSGTKDDPYQISNALQWWYFVYLNYTNGGRLNNYVCLTNDIYLNDGYFESDGTYHDGGDGILYINHPYGGRKLFFDGRGHTVYGSYINRSSNAGLFYVSLYECHISNLQVKNIYHKVTGAYVGAITVYTTDNTIIENCSAEGYVVGSGNGGVSGFAHKYNTSSGLILRNCVNKVNVVSGYMATAMSGTVIENCVNYGNSPAGIVGVGKTLKNFTNY